MSEKKTAEAETPVAEVQPAVSKQRQFAATGTSLVLGVILSAAASYAINKVTVRVHNSINPPPPAEATTTSE
jgi:hypothetical protein